VVGELVICMVVLVSDHRLSPRPDLQSGRPEYHHFLYTNNQSYTFPISTLRTHQRPERANPISRWHRPREIRHTTKLAPTGQKHFIDFSSYRWGESHSSCFIFSRNFTDVASRTSITISRRLRPGLPSQR
jgi:hypothetical protein